MNNPLKQYNDLDIKWIAKVLAFPLRIVRYMPLHSKCKQFGILIFVSLPLRGRETLNEKGYKSDRETKCSTIRMLDSIMSLAS